MSEKSKERILEVRALVESAFPTATLSQSYVNKSVNL